LLGAIALAQIIHTQPHTASTPVPRSRESRNRE
jgi:hypothetical protein